MQEKYEKLRDKLSSLAFLEYGFEYFKKLPFKIKSGVVFSIGNSCNSMVMAINDFNEMYKDKDYSLSYKKQLKEPSNIIRRTDSVHVFAKNIEREFDQYTVIADKYKIDYSDVKNDFYKLCEESKDTLYFLKRGQEFIDKYFQIEKFLSFETDLESREVFIDELLELKNNYSDLFDNLEYISKISASINDIFEKYTKDFNFIVNRLKNKIYDINPNEILSYGDFFIKDIEKIERNSVSDFLIAKENEENISSSFKLTSSQKIESLWIFNDDSIVYKKSGNYYAVQDYLEINNLMKEVEESIIMYQLRKKPQIAKLFLNKYKEDEDYNSIYNLDGVLTVMDTYLKNEQILKNMNFDFEIFNDSSFEVIDDKMHATINEHKLTQYANSILSNKYKFLLDDAVLASFKVLLDAGVSKNTLQDVVGKKIASIQDAEQFNKYLEKVIDHFSGFSDEVLSEKLKSFNINKDYQKDNIVIFEVTDFEQSKTLGSPSWCISRYKSYFSDYTTDESRQFFLYDFNKSEKDNKSMIGFTLYKNGVLRTQHLKNDDYYDTEKYFDDIIDELVYSKKEEFKLSEKYSQQLNLKYNTKNKKQLINNG